MATIEPTADGLDGLVNLRDLGGLPTASGQVTKPGVVYRSDAPHVGDRSPDGFAQWPPAAVVDLRDTVEYGNKPHPLHDRAAVHRLPLLEDIRDGWDDSAGLPALYQHILDDASNKLVEAFRIVLRTDGPVLIHCAAGKDRTGVVSALLLSAAGVDADAILADYVRSDRNMFRVLQRLNSGQPLPPGVDEEAVAELVAAPSEAMESVLARLAEHDGGAGWLVAHGVTGTEVERWQQRFVGGGSDLSTPRSDPPE